MFRAERADAEATIEAQEAILARARPELEVTIANIAETENEIAGLEAELEAANARR
jgi:phage shock protein A